MGCLAFAAITLGFNGADLTVLDFCEPFLVWSDPMLSFWTYLESHSVLFPIGLRLGWSLGTESTFYLLAPFLLRTNVVCIGTLTVSGLVREIVNINFPLGLAGLDGLLHDVVHICPKARFVPIALSDVHSPIRVASMFQFCAQ